MDAVAEATFELLTELDEPLPESLESELEALLDYDDELSEELDSASDRWADCAGRFGVTFACDKGNIGGIGWPR